MSIFTTAYQDLCDSVSKGVDLEQKAKHFKTAFEAAEDGITSLWLYPEGNIICCVRTRDDFAPIRALHKGVWKKSITSDNEILYSAEVDGIPISVVVSEIPPSCKIIEEEVFIPAHTEIKRRVVCRGSETIEAHSSTRGSASITSI